MKDNDTFFRLDIFSAGLMSSVSVCRSDVVSARDHFFLACSQSPETYTNRRLYNFLAYLIKKDNQY